jgi:hypothetical protein
MKGARSGAHGRRAAPVPRRGRGSFGAVRQGSACELLARSPVSRWCIETQPSSPNSREPVRDPTKVDEHGHAEKIVKRVVGDDTVRLGKLGWIGQRPRQVGRDNRVMRQSLAPGELPVRESAYHVTVRCIASGAGQGGRTRPAEPDTCQSGRAGPGQGARSARGGTPQVPSGQRWLPCQPVPHDPMIVTPCRRGLSPLGSGRASSR